METSKPYRKVLSAPNNVSRREKLVAAGKEYRDLGFFTKALECYREAEKIQGDLDLSLKIVGVMNEQGRVPLAFEELSKAMDLYCRDTNDTETTVVGELSCIYFDAVMKA